MALKGKLEKLLGKTPGNKESFSRSMLLSIDQQSQQETHQLRIQSVVRKVSSCVHDLLSDTQYNEFRNMGNDSTSV